MVLVAATDGRCVCVCARARWAFEETQAELRRSLASHAHESYRVLAEPKPEPEEDDESPGSESDGDEPLTWADKIEWALQQHGGEATLSEIYCAIEVGFPEDIADKPNWQPAIRSCLSTNTRKGFRFAVVDSPDGRRFRLSAKARPGSHN
jgi:hypothetical protein